MQFVSLGDNLHEISKPVFWEKSKKKNICLSSIYFAQRVVKVEADKTFYFTILI